MAFVFGSIASGNEGAASDIDLMVIGSIGLRALSGVLADFRSVIGREVNHHVFSTEEFIRRKREGEHFISTVLTSSKLFVKGAEHELAEMG
jgi:predicted nucleotidyltransferase